MSEFSDEEIQRLWPQAAGELRGFTIALHTSRMGITATQVEMAIQLADEAFRARARTITIDVCPNCHMPKMNCDCAVDPRNPAAVALSKLGAAKGGNARAASLAPAERGAIARKAAKARWGKPQDEAPKGAKG
jgi:hypothetical protein